MQNFHILSFLCGLLLGIVALIFSFIFRLKKQTNNGKEVEQSRVIEELSKEKSITQEKLSWVEEHYASDKTKWQEKDKLLDQSQKDALLWKERHDQVQRELEKLNKDQKELSEQLQLKMKLMSEEIFENQSKKFREASGKDLQNILGPLKERINQFEKKVGESYDRELRDKISLKEEISKLIDLNRKVSDEANHLAKALKGDVKAQGSWGELILERVLEMSGLVKGQEFRLQISQFNEEGKRIQPDAVVDLPDGKHIIVDSKVSLVAYERYLHAEDEKEKDLQLKDHIGSVRRHIQELGKKRYETATELNTPELVLLFMPIEAAYITAVQHENAILEDAFKEQIVIVCPSTLLATMKTVSSLWKLEKQNRFAEKIAHESGMLYNKFVGFVTDLKNVEQYLTKGKDACDQAFRKLKDGPGNLISKVENIKKLGAKTNKQISPDLIEEKGDDEELVV